MVGTTHTQLQTVLVPIHTPDMCGERETQLAYCNTGFRTFFTQFRNCSKFLSKEVDS
jgi:hypothetical protein